MGAWSFVTVISLLWLTCFRDLDRELVLMKGHRQYMHDKLAQLEVSTNCSIATSKLVFVYSRAATVWLNMSYTIFCCDMMMCHDVGFISKNFYLSLREKSH